MIRKHFIDLDSYPIHKLIMEMFECDNLMFLHEQIEDWDSLPMAEVGKDQATPLHKRFYAGLETDVGRQFLDAYRELVRTIYLNGWAPGVQGWGTGAYISDLVFPPSTNRDWRPTEDILFQKIPTFRAHIPGNKAVGGKTHCDSDYNHPLGEINFLLPLTPMFGTNSVYTETARGRRDFQFLQGDPGELIEFDGNTSQHGNVPNTTGFTRVSIDFRILPIHRYDPDFGKDSIAYGLKFTEGQYYERMRCPSW